MLNFDSDTQQSSAHAAYFNSAVYNALLDQPRLF